MIVLGPFKRHFHGRPNDLSRHTAVDFGKLSFVSLYFIFFGCCFRAASEQGEAGTAREAAAAKRCAEQKEPGGGSDGAETGRAATETVEEEERPAAEGQPACETERRLFYYTASKNISNLS